MREHFRAAYDEEWCAALYECYETGDDSVLNELLGRLCALIRRVYLQEVAASRKGDQSLIEGEALEEVYRVVELKTVPNHHPKVFTKFLSVVIVRSIRDSLRRLGCQTFDYWKVAKTPNPEPLPSPDIVEQRIYHDQVTELIRDRVRRRIRFIGSEAEACKFILDCALGYKDIDPKAAKRRFKLTSHRCNYLIRYIRIMTKAAAYEQRDRERKSGTLTSIWEAGGGILRPASEFGKVHIPS